MAAEAEEAEVSQATRISRRQFLKTGAAGSATFAASAAIGAPSPAREARPNFLFIITDQQGLDTISAAGCTDVHTPNMDRLARRGVFFSESYSTNPLCSPARSSMFTGRPTLETGVIQNNLPIRPDMPNIGQWLGPRGYEMVYAGKWHVPNSWPARIPGFRVIPTGMGGQGQIGDAAISRACQGDLRNRKRSDPFFLVASFLQPHDVCQYVSMYRNAPDELPYPQIADQLPELPPNFEFDRREPARLARFKRPQWSEQQWRYYVWNYHRMVEMVDAEIGRVLQALDDSGYADSTIVIFTADHGEGRGRHQMVLKNYLYDEAAKVPLIVSCLGRVLAGKSDKTHLVSGVDIVPTVCDYAGIASPPDVRGRSLRPFLEGKDSPSHEFVFAEVTKTGRMIRTDRYKYVMYHGDEVEQLFDMQADPWETKNLASESPHADALKGHQKLLAEWEAKLHVHPQTPTKRTSVCPRNPRTSRPSVPMPSRPSKKPGLTTLSRCLIPSISTMRMRTVTWLACSRTCVTGSQRSRARPSCPNGRRTEPRPRTSRRQSRASGTMTMLG